MRIYRCCNVGSLYSTDSLTLESLLLCLHYIIITNLV
jgi:hypothetical protein